MLKMIITTQNNDIIHIVNEDPVFGENFNICGIAKTEAGKHPKNTTTK